MARTNSPVPQQRTSSPAPHSDAAPVLGRYEPAEPRLLRAGKYGPVLRARDLRGKQLVALKVFNASEAYRLGALKNCGSLNEAQRVTQAAFRSQVRALRQASDAAAAASKQPEGFSAVVGLLDYSRDSSGQPAAADDGCYYMVLELGIFTMEQLVRDSREVERQPRVAEVRETVRLVISALAKLHAGGYVLSDHSPRQWMRFPVGWKAIDAEALCSANHMLSLDRAAADPLYRAPEFAAAVGAGQRKVALTPAMDVWAVALICLELVLPEPLFRAQLEGTPNASPWVPHPFYATLARLSSPLALPPAVEAFAQSTLLLDMMHGLLHVDPARRLTAAAALEHPFFTTALPPSASASRSGSRAASRSASRTASPTFGRRPASPPPARVLAWDGGAGVGIDGGVGEWPTGAGPPPPQVSASPLQPLPPGMPPPPPVLQQPQQPSAPPQAGKVAERQAVAARAREQALAELHAATLQLGAVQVALGAQGDVAGMLAAAGKMSPAPGGPGGGGGGGAGGPGGGGVLTVSSGSPALGLGSTGLRSPDKVAAGGVDTAASQQLREELSFAKGDLQKAKQEAEELRRRLADKTARDAQERDAQAAAGARREEQSAVVSEASEEIAKLKSEMRQLLKEAGAHEVERQMLKDQLELKSREPSPQVRKMEAAALDPAAEARRLADMRRTNEVLEEARTRTENALRQLAEVQRHNGELEAEASALRTESNALRARQASAGEAQGRVEAAEAARQRTDALLSEANASLEGKRIQLAESEASLKRAEEQLLASDRLRREAEKSRAASESGESVDVAKTYQEADKRVKEVRTWAEEQLREERRRSKDDLIKAEKSARRVQEELQRQLAEAHARAGGHAPDRALRTQDRLGPLSRISEASGTHREVEAQRIEMMELREALEVSEAERMRMVTEVRMTEERLLGTAEAADMGFHAEKSVAMQLCVHGEGSRTPWRGNIPGL